MSALTPFAPSFLRNLDNDFLKKCTIPNFVKSRVELVPYISCKSAINLEKKSTKMNKSEVFLVKRSKLGIVGIHSINTEVSSLN